MKTKISLSICAAVVALLLGVALGSVFLPPGDILRVIGRKLGMGFLAVEPSSVAIVWDMRLPRVALAFVAGGALSVSGAVMQSILRNPLASPYTLGVSSGASLGACIVILYGVTFPRLSALTLPVTGFLFGLSTILFAIGLASRLDGHMQNNTIILTGMVFSLFINAVTTLLSALSSEHMERLLYWQMGSFSMKGWPTVFILAPIAAAGTLFVTRYGKELDAMTFGEEQASAIGVDTKRVKWVLLIASAALTGSAIAFVGVIGFVDLVAPHIVRGLFGASHRRVIPLSALFGGAFMVLCDLAARTAIPSGELPVGAVTAMIGAPFFAMIYFSGRKGGRA